MIYSDCYQIRFIVLFSKNCFRRSSRKRCLKSAVCSNRTLTAKFLDNEAEYLPFYVYVANDQAANWDSGIVIVYLDDVQVAQVNATNSGYKGMAMDMPYSELVTLEVPKSDPDEAIFDGWYENGIKKNISDRKISFYPGQDLPEVRHITARWISR